jgi:hypothetical protein
MLKSGSPGWDSNRIPHEYKSSVSLLGCYYNTYIIMFNNQWFFLIVNFQNIICIQD